MLNRLHQFFRGKKAVEPKTVGFEIALAAIALAGTEPVLDFGEKEKLSVRQRDRLWFSIALVNLTFLADFLNRVEPQNSRVIIDSMLECFFEVLGGMEQSGKLGGIVVLDDELELFRSEEGMHPETMTNLHTIARILYRSRMSDYMDRITESHKTGELFGPVGGVAFRICEEVVGRRLVGADDFEAEDVPSPIGLSIILTPMMLFLHQQTKEALGK